MGVRSRALPGFIPFFGPQVPNLPIGVIALAHIDLWGFYPGGLDNSLVFSEKKKACLFSS